MGTKKVMIKVDEFSVLACVADFLSRVIRRDWARVENHRAADTNDFRNIRGCGIVPLIALCLVAMLFTFGGPRAQRPQGTLAAAPTDYNYGQGYVEVGANGYTYTFGNAGYYGSMGGQSLSAPIVGIAETQDEQGYWLVGSDGGVYSFGDAHFYNSVPGEGITLNRPIVGMAETPDGGGYWLVGADGGVFSFGDAMSYGSLGGETLSSPIVGMAVMPTGQGYWLVAANGGIFSFGTANFENSLPGIGVSVSNIVGMVATSDGYGYWIIGSNGGVYAFGDAPYLGSLGSTLSLPKAIVGAAATFDNGGYWLMGSDGGVVSYGDAQFEAGLAGTGNTDLVGIAVTQANANMVGFISSCGAAYAEDTPGQSNWVAETACGGAEQIAVGGSRIVIITGTGAVDEKDGLYGSWTQIDWPGDGRAIAVGSTGLIMLITACGAAYGETVPGQNNWVSEDACGGASKIAVGGNYILIINSQGGTWEKYGLNGAGTQIDWNGDGEAIAVSANGLIMLITGCSAVYDETTPGQNYWTLQVPCGDARAISVGGSQMMYIDDTGTAWAKNGPASTWVQVTPTGDADAIAAGDSSSQMAVIDAHNTLFVGNKLGLISGWRQVDWVGDADAVSVG